MYSAQQRCVINQSSIKKYKDKKLNTLQHLEKDKAIHTHYLYSTWYGKAPKKWRSKKKKWRKFRTWVKTQLAEPILIIPKALSFPEPENNNNNEKKKVVKDKVRFLLFVGGMEYIETPKDCTEND